MNPSKAKIIQTALTDYNENIVKINYDLIPNLRLNKKEIIEQFNNDFSDNPFGSLAEAIHYTLAKNSINFQYWDLDDNGFKRYTHNGNVGAIACSVGFDKLWWNTRYEIFNINSINTYFGDIPLKQERFNILSESLDFEKAKEAIDIITKAVYSNNINLTTAIDVAQILPLSFDEPYYKKIQLALYEIGALAKHWDLSPHVDLTIAADYQLPKVLENLGVLTYSNNLIEKINNKTLIDKDSAEEKAIRAATILSCEEISHHHNMEIPLIDRYLWLMRNSNPSKQFHLTKTTDY